ncbi:epoxide hydrolase family protein [Plantibacter sp. YIM 135249]|uniref:epoxide hydrolase family protein n=1 Tax=Plantibacter sp. YIM 135249 TaxID=3423918 RepID=UPI003D326103
MSATASPSESRSPSTDIRPFELRIPNRQLSDLRNRLDHVRWPDRETDASHGPSLATMQSLVARWKDGYDWRVVERELNDLGQFVTTIDGLDIHFLHVRSPEPDALPLILTHGWPGSVLEFRKVIGPLTDPAAHGGDPRQAFHVVVPSLPGFAFSDKPTSTGWGFPRIADAWITLMDRLGYDRWAAQGGDLGAAVTEEIAQKAPEALVGINLNFAMLFPTPHEIADATPEEQALLAAAGSTLQGYFGMQSESPQTIGYSLADSPVGLAAWITAVVQDNVGTRGDALGSLTVDELLDDITLYWLTNTGTSSARSYWEMMRNGWWPPVSAEHPVTVPAGFSWFPGEHQRKSRRWVDSRYTNVVHFNEAPAGGHFAALEQPGHFVEELRASFSTLR